jgi:hypothetical protein
MLFVTSTFKLSSVLSLKKLLNTVLNPQYKPLSAVGHPYTQTTGLYTIAPSEVSRKQSVTSYGGYGLVGATAQTGSSSSYVRFFFMLLSGGWGIVNFTGRATSGSFYPLLSRFILNTSSTQNSAALRLSGSTSASTSVYLFTAQFQWFN